VKVLPLTTALISGMLEYEFLYEYTWPENMLFAKPLFTGSLAGVAATVFWYSLMVILVMLFVSGGSLVLRLRRSVGEERQQLKWVVYSVALLHAQGRNRPGGIRRRPGRGGEGDDAASPRLAVAAPRNDLKGRAGTVAGYGWRARRG
jgi:hypothetical protein